MKNIIFVFMICFCINKVVYADTLTIVHINDTHSNLTSGGRRDVNLKGTIGGIARAATFIGNAKATWPNVLTLHSGDIFIGDLFFQQYYGGAELQLMGAIGFDAMTLGNHEFDLTPDVLKSTLDKVFALSQPFPLLSANLILDNVTVKGLKKYIQGYTIKKIGNLKVGIFGLTTPSTNLMSLPSPAIIDDNIIGIASQTTASLKSQGCDIVILLSHLGLKGDKEIASNVSNINLIVGGHDHYVIDKAIEVNGTPIVQAGAFYHEIGMVQLEIINSKVKLLNSSVTKLDENIKEDLQISVTLAQLVSDIESVYGKVYTQKIANAENDVNEVSDKLLEDGFKDTEIGNLVTDSYKAFAKTDIAIQPGGSTAQMLYKGSIVADDAFRVVGYGFNTTNGLGFEIVTFNVSGLDLMTGLEFGLSNIEENDEFLIQVSGIKYTYNYLAQQGQRLQSVEINGKPINPLATYSVASNAFVLGFFNIIGINPTEIHVLKDTTEFFVLSNYLQLIQKVTPKIEGRIVGTNKTSVRDINYQSTNSVLLSPNPTDSYTKLNLKLNQHEKVKLVIYSSNLKEIAVPFDGTLDEGVNNIEIDTRYYDSGAYIYKLFLENNFKVGCFIVKK